jgi:hypothetical protein
MTTTTEKNNKSDHAKMSSINNNHYDKNGKTQQEDIPHGKHNACDVL